MSFRVCFLCVLLMGFSTTFKGTSLIVRISVWSIVLLLESCVATEVSEAGNQIALCRCFGTIPVGELVFSHVVSVSLSLLFWELQMPLLKTRREDKGWMDVFVTCLCSGNTHLHCIYCIIHNILCIQTIFTLVAGNCQVHSGKR